MVRQRNPETKTQIRFSRLGKLQGKAHYPSASPIPVSGLVQVTLELQSQREKATNDAVLTLIVAPFENHWFWIVEISSITG